MILKNTVKTMIRTPIVYLLFFVLLTLITIFLQFGYITYKIGTREQDNITNNYKIIATLDAKKKDNSGSTNISPEHYQLVQESSTVNTSNVMVHLVGTLSDKIRLPFLEDKYSIEEHMWITGQLMDLKMDSLGDLKGTLTIEQVLFASNPVNKNISVNFYNQTSINLYEKYLGKNIILGLYNREGIYSIINEYTILANDSGQLSLDNQENIIANLKSSEEEKLSHAIYNMNLLYDTKNRFPIYFTNDFDSMYNKINNTILISSGREFTKEEYNQWGKVCMVSTDFSKKFNLSVGDSITFDNFDSQVGFDNVVGLPHILTDKDNMLSNYGGRYDKFTEGIGVEYKIVGIYKSTIKDPANNYYIDPNTIYIPFEKEYDMSLYPKYYNNLTFTLNSPFEIQNFIMEMANIELINETYFIEVNDDGYSFITHIVTSLVENGRMLLLITSIAFLCITLIFLMYYDKNRKIEYGISRIMGQSRLKASAMYLIGLFILLIFSTGIGSLISSNLYYTYLKSIHADNMDRAYDLGLENIGLSSSYVINTEVGSNYYLVPVFIIFATMIFSMVILLFFKGKKSLSTILRDNKF